MGHSFPPDFGLNDLNTAFLTNNASVFHAFVFSAITLVILGRTKNFGAEQAVPLGLERSVIDGFGFFDLPEGPLPDLLRRGQRQTDSVVSSWIGGLCEEIV